jgi:hypothetical protein
MQRENIESQGQVELQERGPIQLRWREWTSGWFRTWAKVGILLCCFLTV